MLAHNGSYQCVSTRKEQSPKKSRNIRALQTKVDLPQARHTDLNKNHEHDRKARRYNLNGLLQGAEKQSPRQLTHATIYVGKVGVLVVSSPLLDRFQKLRQKVEVGSLALCIAHCYHADEENKRHEVPKLGIPED